MFFYSFLLFFLLFIGHCPVFSAHDIHRLKDEKGQTELHKLCLFNNSEDEIEILLKQRDENGIDTFITVIDNEGNTALHLAVISRCCSEKTLRSIIGFYKKAIGEDGKKLFQILMAKNKKKETPLQLMVQIQRDKNLIISLLKEIFSKCKIRYSEVIHEIIKGGKNFIIAPTVQERTYYDELREVFFSNFPRFGSYFLLSEIQIKADEDESMSEDEYISFIQKRIQEKSFSWASQWLNYKDKTFNVLGFFIEKEYTISPLHRFILLFPEETAVVFNNKADLL